MYCPPGERSAAYLVGVSFRGCTSPSVAASVFLRRSYSVPLVLLRLYSNPFWSNSAIAVFLVLSAMAM